MEVDFPRRLVVEIVHWDGEGVAVVAVHGDDAALLLAQELFRLLVGDGVFRPSHGSEHVSFPPFRVVNPVNRA